MVAFNVTIHAKFLKNLFRGAELQLEGKTQVHSTRMLNSSIYYSVSGKERELTKRKHGT
jgi:hypothetical protein